MARKLDSYEFPQRPKEIHPWDVWLDGNIWELTRGEDFDCTTGSLRSQAHREARLRGGTVNTASPEPERLVLQYSRPQTTR